MKLVLGTMTFGESVFAPNVGEFVEMFLDAGHEELDTLMSTMKGTVKNCWERFCLNSAARIKFQQK